MKAFGPPNISSNHHTLAECPTRSLLHSCPGPKKCWEKPHWPPLKLWVCSVWYGNNSVGNKWLVTGWHSSKIERIQVQICFLSWQRDGCWLNEQIACSLKQEDVKTPWKMVHLVWHCWIPPQNWTQVCALKCLKCGALLCEIFDLVINCVNLCF